MIFDIQNEQAQESAINDMYRHYLRNEFGSNQLQLISKPSDSKEAKDFIDIKDDITQGNYRNERAEFIKAMQEAKHLNLNNELKPS